jgi:hypothetical protein
MLLKMAAAAELCCFVLFVMLLALHCVSETQKQKVMLWYTSSSYCLISDLERNESKTLKMKGITRRVVAGSELWLYKHDKLRTDFYCLVRCQASWRWQWTMPSSGILHRVALVRTYVSEERSSSIIRLTRIGELGTTLAITSNRRTLFLVLT